MARPTIYTYSIEDYLNKKASSTVYVAYDALTLSLSQLEQGWQNVGGLIAPLTQGKITGGRITIEQDPTGSWNTGKPASGVAVNVIGGFNFAQAGSPYVQDAVVAAFTPSKFLNDIPDPTDSDVAAFVTAMTTAIVSGAIFANSKYNNALTSLVNTFQGNRKYKRKSVKQYTV
jgi:hypothetical protein